MNRRGAVQLLRRALQRKRLRLVVIRESDEHNLAMFDGMREQSLNLLAHEPAIAAIHAAGMAPMTCGDSFTIHVEDKNGASQEITIPVTPLGGSATTRVFSYGGYVHLWSMSSAAKETPAGINEFTQTLIDCIEQYKPVEIYAANISRLVRSQQQAALLLRALLNRVEIVWAGSVPFHFKGAAAQTGMLFFSIIAMMAAIERDWIVQRLLCGHIASWRAGKWAFGDSMVPFGYRLNSDTGKLEINPDQVEVVREMLIILSQPDVPDSELVRQLGAIGVTGSRKAIGKNYRPNIADLVQARSAIETLFGSATVWIDGEYLLRQRLGFHGLKTLNGLPVMRVGDEEAADQLESLGVLDELETILGADGDESDMFGVDENTLNVIEETFRELDEDDGEVQMLYKLPVPEGGWAEPEVLAAFAAAVLERHQRLAPSRTAMRPLSPDVATESSNPTLHAQLMNGTHLRGVDKVNVDRRINARARSDIAALSGASWTRDGWVYETFSHQRSHIEVRAFPVPVAGETPSGKTVQAHDGTVASRDRADRKVMARFPFQLVVESFVKHTAQALRDGMPIEIRGDATMAHHSPLAISPDALDAAIKFQKESIVQAEGIIDRAAAAQLRTDDERLQESYRAQALAASKNLDKASAKLRELEDRVALPEKAVAAFTSNVEVMVAGLTRLLTCGNSISQTEYLALRSLMRRLRFDRSSDGQWVGSVHLQFTTSFGVVELGPISFPVGNGGHAASAAFDQTREIRADHPEWIRRKLVGTGQINEQAARMLMLHPFKQVPYIVLAGLGAHPFPEWVTAEWRHPTFVAWILDRYTDPDFKWHKRPYKVNAERQFLVHLANRYGTASLAEFGLHVPPWNRHAFVVAARVGRWSRHGIRAWQPSIQPASTRKIRNRPYAPLRCGCGEPLRWVARYPEVLTDMLCDCGRMGGIVAGDVEVPDDLRFPAEYRAVALDWETCLAEMQRRSDVERRNLRGHARAVLMSDALQRGGHIATEIAVDAGVSRPAVGQALTLLQDYGYVVEGRLRRIKSPEWSLSPEGCEVVASMRAETEPRRERVEV